MTPAPRGLEERLRDTRAKLETGVDAWVTTSCSPGGVHLIPLSYSWDGSVFPGLRRIKAWREANEVPGRTLMRNGHWLG